MDYKKIYSIVHIYVNRILKQKILPLKAVEYSACSTVFLFLLCLEVQNA